MLIEISKILVISILLQNGGEVVFEINNKFSSRRINSIIRGDDKINHLLIFVKDSNIVYDFDLEIGLDKHQKFSEFTEIEDKNFNEVFMENLEIFYVDDYRIVCETFGTDDKIQYKEYYMQLDGFNGIIQKSYFDPILRVVDDSYIFLYEDFVTSNGAFISAPLKVSVEWKNEFSDVLKNSIEYLKGIEK